MIASCIHFYLNYQNILLKLDMRIKNKKFIIPAIFLIALGLRLIRIAGADLWRDEAFSVRAADQRIIETIKIIAKDTAPPLHSIILHYWIELFGTSELSVRMPSLIFGMLTFYYFLKLAKLVLKEDWQVYLASIFFAINPVLIWYSQEARSYSMLVFFASASLHYSLKIFNQKTNRTVDLIVLFLLTTFGLYTHNLFIFVAPVNFLTTVIYLKGRINLQALKNSKKEYIKILIPYILASIVFLPWFIIILKQISTVSEGGFWLKLEPIRSPLGFIGSMFTGDNFPMTDLNLAAAGVLGLTGGLIFLLSLYTTFKESGNKNLKALQFWFWAVAILVYIYSFKTSFFYIRYLQFLIPAALILMVSALGTIKLKVKILYIFVITLLLICTSFILVQQKIYIPKSKAPMSKLIVQLDKDYNKEDLILNADAFTHHAFNVYSDKENFIYNEKDDIPYYAGTAVLKASDFYIGSKPVENYDQIWVIYLWSERNEITEDLQTNYVMTEKFDYDQNLHLEKWENK